MTAKPPIPVRLRSLHRRDYAEVYQAMRVFTDRRDHSSVDELWLTEHPAVFTQGLNGKPEHLLDIGSFDVVHADRGGQVTFHGPGQLVVYVLFDLRRTGLGVRTLVTLLEQSVVDLLGYHGITALPRAEAPGVYVGRRKIASLGLRIRRGCSYHGLSLNVAMDLGPFKHINPCGMQGLQMTQMVDFGIQATVDEIGSQLADHLLANLGAIAAETLTALPDAREPA